MPYFTPGHVVRGGGRRRRRQPPAALHARRPGCQEPSTGGEAATFPAPLTLSGQQAPVRAAPASGPLRPAPPRSPTRAASAPSGRPGGAEPARELPPARGRAERSRGGGGTQSARALGEPCGPRPVAPCLGFLGSGGCGGVCVPMCEDGWFFSPSRPSEDCSVKSSFALVDFSPEGEIKPRAGRKSVIPSKGP
ncbi:bcl-2-binding component 3, isoforms 3/4-like [Gallus gallus]|uniref:bcl-2-binding component 3, isoforms 3/4-like n=1 Tax=Gallus gallus TaxID=9031 RepID=UPI001AE88F46|nr:bcl-2-binding component 3, isoforms 3/4-like [Gallus gallus]XP_040556195.1 bcl-2-binding component 3, isoforms 3/4-like [Gallus gallus]